MDSIAGLGKESRKRLAAIIRRTRGTISVADAAEILGLPAEKAAKMLARWARQGWLSRARQGLYVPVPMEASTADVTLDDPWLLAERLYSPCYIGGWSAAEHWGLTEQIFRTVVVLTTLKPRNRKPKIKGVEFLLRTISAKALFGTKPVWRGQAKINVSDQTRTVLDMLDDPGLGGGLRPVADVFRNYMGSDAKNTALLIEYADRLGNGAVLKRLGFLAERFAPNEKELIKKCRERLTKGNTRLDPVLSAKRLVSAWRLWVPAGWMKE
jgi:predicted transcriptional regulator of viral defense system